MLLDSMNFESNKGVFLFLEGNLTISVFVNSFDCPENRTANPEWSCPEFQEDAD